MTVDEFLAWGEEREGRWELQDGEVLAMSPERYVHIETKFEVAAALKGAIRRLAAPRGPGRRDSPHRRAHRIRTGRDRLLRPAPAAGEGRVLGAPHPSRGSISGTAARDHGVKLTGYFSLPSCPRRR
jgi:Putative restriction endonuclease